MADLPTPRIDATMLEAFAGKTVRIVGKVVQVRGDNSAVIDCNGSVVVNLIHNTNVLQNHAVEITGKVSHDGSGSVKELMSTDFGTSLDLNAAQAVVDATHRFKEIFYNDDR